MEDPGDENTCQHGCGEPIYRLGAPLRRCVRTGEMGETSDGQPAAGPQNSEDDPDSPAKSSFFTRLFRRENPEDDEPLDEPTRDGRAAVTGARAMLINLRNMRRMRVDDVSVPRAEVVAVSDQASLEEVVEVFQSSTLSRLPVYAETLDQPVGLVHLKDLALKYGFGAARRRV